MRSRLRGKGSSKRNLVSSNREIGRVLGLDRGRSSTGLTQERLDRLVDLKIGCETELVGKGRRRGRMSKLREG